MPHTTDRISSYTNEKFLINSIPPGRPETDENTVLFSNIFIQVAPGEANRIALHSHVSNFIDFMERDGWYKNVVPDEVPDSRKGDLYLSRDQMFSYSVFSKLAGLKHHEQIYRTIRNNFFTYDNVKRGFNIRRLVRPKDWIFLGYLCGSWLCWLLMPWYYFLGIITFAFGGNTNFSGEQLYFHNAVADKHLLKKPFYWLYRLMLKRRTKSESPWRYMLGHYYGLSHPIYLDGTEYEV